MNKGTGTKTKIYYIIAVIGHTWRAGYETIIRLVCNNKPEVV